LVVLFAALAMTACRRRREPVEGSTVTIGGPSVTAGAEGQCTATLAVGQVVPIRPTCQIDQRVSAQATTLVYPCGGGQAQATFADAVFMGTVMNGHADLSIETSFPFSDGCTWRSKQHITGDLASGALAYTYEETPEPGQSGCAAGCTGSASVQVQ
jgi:hypothetical protein